MYNNINPNLAIEYDPDIISKIKEMIKDGFDKLKSFVKSKTRPKFDVYHELDEKFNEIALKLEKYEIFKDELNYFLLISDKILHIVYKNCKNNLFGHYDFALDLFNFFMEIWNVKINLLNNYTSLELEKYQNFKEEINNEYFQLNKKFHMEIYEPDENYCEKEIYRVMESMRG